MTNNINSYSWPGDLIDQATVILMDGFDVDAVTALEVLRRMSQNTNTQMCVVAEQVINHQVPVAAIRGIEDAVRAFSQQSGHPAWAAGRTISPSVSTRAERHQLHSPGPAYG
jgi:hypothetical protein